MEHTVVRGVYNATTPFHMWHKVASVGDFDVTTVCGLRYSEHNIADIEPFTVLEAKRGDRCQTDACGMKGM